MTCPPDPWGIFDTSNARSVIFQATNNWLQRASTDIPYAQTLQDKLRGLQELNLSEMGLFTVPEELFLKR